jgi:hypothetical protein
MKTVKVRKAGKMRKPKKKYTPTEAERKRNAARWKQERQGL